MRFRSLALAGFALSLVAAQTPGTVVATGAAPAPAAAPSSLKPFAEVVKDAKRSDGLFPLWQKEDKVWMEIRTDQMGPLFFFTANQVTGLGERGIYGGQMGDSYAVYFRRIGNHLQMLAKNTTHTADPKAPISRAVQDAFSDSLLGSAPVLSQPHPERGSVLVEANALFVRDLPMGATMLERTYRQPYAFDAANSSIQKVYATEDMAGFRIDAHYALARLVLPPMLPPGAPPAPQMPLPGTLEDVRSLFLGYYFSLAKLPDQPMQPRLADDRVGHFVTTRWDWASDMQDDQRAHYVHRWRLEKADPAAAMSKPKKPIVYWLDRNIPEAYRETVKAGILEWNKAFERIGFQDAIEVRQQPDTADWDTLDARNASIRWFVGTDAGFAIGPSRVDPRTGEILDADIGMSDVFTRGGRTQFREELPPATAAPLLPGDARLCTFMSDAAAEMDMAAELLEARGEFEPGSLEEDAFVKAYLKDVVMHEVGHTLGLRHNFRASTVYTPQQLSDRAFTQVNGVTGSVMDYTPVNLARKGEKQGDYFMPTLGPYDYWAVEYAYKPLDAGTEAQELGRIAARGEREPVLAYATDEEAGYGELQGMDPEVNRFDLGRDPLQYLAARIDLSRELLDRLQVRPLKPGTEYRMLRRTVNRALNSIGAAAQNAAKYLGGVVYLRDHAGSARTPLTPVNAARQREALHLLQSSVFDMNAVKLRPDFMARLTVNQFDRFSAGNGVAPDYSLGGSLLRMQRSVLAQILQPSVLQRILDGPEKMADPKDAFHLPELFDGLQAAVWQEAQAGRDPGAVRRSLQREHLRQMVNLLLRPAPGTPDDARGLARESLKSLQARLKAAALKPAFSRETKAHFAECQALIEEALKSQVQRLAF